MSECSGEGERAQRMFHKEGTTKNRNTAMTGHSGTSEGLHTQAGLSPYRHLRVFVCLFVLPEGFLKNWSLFGTSLVVQWLRLQAPNAGGQGSIPGQGTRSHMLQLRPRAAK